MSVIYRPEHQQQLHPHTPTSAFDCNPTSAAIAADRATIGGVLITGREVRLASSEPKPDPHSPGLSMAQSTAAVYRLTRVVLTPRRGPWSAMVKHLGPSGVMLPGDYDQLPAAFKCQANFNGLHMIFLNNENTGPVECADGITYRSGLAALTYDPLCPSFRWMPLAILRRYAEKYARAVGYNGGVIYATTRPTPLIDSN